MGFSESLKPRIAFQNFREVFLLAGELVAGTGNSDEAGDSDWAAKVRREPRC
jgi:hypothetical protein